MHLFCECVRVYTVRTQSRLLNASVAFGCKASDTGCRFLALIRAVRGGSKGPRGAPCFTWKELFSWGFCPWCPGLAASPLPGHAPCWSGPWPWLSFPAWQPWTSSLLQTCQMIWLTLFTVTGPVLLALLRCHGTVPLSGRALPCLPCSHPWLLAYKHACTYLSTKVVFWSCSSVRLLLMCFATQIISGKLLWDAGLPVAMCSNYEMETFMFRYHRR